MMLYWLLQVPAVPTPDTSSLEKFIYSVIGAAVPVILYFIFNRGKVKTDSDASYHRMALEDRKQALEVSQSLAEWIERYEKLSERLSSVVEQMSTLKQHLAERTEERDDLKDLLAEARDLLAKFEDTLQDLIEHNHLLDDLVALKRKVQKHISEEKPGLLKPGS